MDEKTYVEMLEHFGAWGPGFLIEKDSQYITEFLGDSINILRYQKSNGDQTNKDLWFLLDETPERRMVWMKKAVSTAVLHKLPFMEPIQWMRECKKLLKEDHQNGINAYASIGQWND